ncbi:MAG: metallophosphoesterase, partial [Lachnospiraceae bacterium]|nr:metallophosphoesterase [Lachnospiraceae bacterium]
GPVSGKLFLILILIAMLLALAVWIICVMIRDNRRFVVREYCVKSAKLPRPVTLVFLSDMHENTYGEDNADVVKAIDEARPDVILVGGDMIISSKAAVGEEDWYENTVSLLKKLSQKYPIIATDGNHETALRVSRHHTSCYSMLRLKYDELGINFLDNESIALESADGKQIIISGLCPGKRWYKKFH